jgi:hypothetical protein
MLTQMKKKLTIRGSQDINMDFVGTRMIAIFRDWVERHPEDKHIIENLQWRTEEDPPTDKEREEIFMSKVPKSMARRLAVQTEGMGFMEVISVARGAKFLKEDLPGTCRDCGSRSTHGNDWGGGTCDVCGGHNIIGF